MLLILVDALLGGVAGLLGFWIARLIDPNKTKPQMQRLLPIALITFSLPIGRAVVNPMVEGWRRSDQIETLFRTDPLYGRVLKDHPELAEPLRAALLKAYASGSRDEAQLAGKELLSAALPDYLSRASDEGVLGFTRSMVALLRAMQAENPDYCYTYLFATGKGSIGMRHRAEEEGLANSMRQVITGAAQQPVTQGADAESNLASVMDKLQKRELDTSVLQHVTDPDVDRSAACNVTIQMYATVLELPPAQAAHVLRYIYK